MNAYTLDTGALIAIERKRQRALAMFRVAKQDGIALFVPSVCVAEWWRARTDLRDDIIASSVIVQTDTQLMKLAGEAIASVVGATCIDAIVMATAARTGGVVFTSDMGDLTRLQRFFPSVRILEI
jgi:predicted nucleic acid-binding protein